ncbi:hypothetical protein CPAR01_12688 [Colletotrichum paranaense]|uniref:Uncharacterized protein n=4 Tax=Colletotrichum acutatum species complex TaxID=2707335 RepID=A0AAI9YRT5_9PEZI|nr:uncharacterized protein CCOS01_10753 [Colletotrichum costaricense]XP_060344476.1 uncharacterized protein CPAR01_12688 [Colletotrichum paranaense]XP_060380831.1 uncharacterized protein CTAM01_08592 [Colletotrichum tamarilloi]KAK1463450.1 hypothetical protein CMEL01_13519 [Colletotrichum melonis]KAK1719251.1 hypothetical protein BDP67DRAFT_504702 [Colletotrichum lupini]KAK1495463.1 hypothetical protein CTAM01_08592 [Colletotrichum tamarilloi]KAK1520634.1 hypothetical protein CCOS01_10753 [Co
MAKGRVSRTGLEASNTPLTARRGLWTYVCRPGRPFECSHGCLDLRTGQPAAE